MGRYSPPLADRIAANWASGIVSVVHRLLVINPPLLEQLSGAGGLETAIARAAPAIASSTSTLPPFRDIRKQRWQGIPVHQRPKPYPNALTTRFDCGGLESARLNVGDTYGLQFDIKPTVSWPELEVVFFLRAMNRSGVEKWTRYHKLGANSSPGHQPRSLEPTGDDWLVTCG